MVELGTGSGIILAFLTAHAPTLFGRPDILTLGLDINPEACIATVKTVERACADVRSQITRNEDGDGDEDAGVEGGEGGEEGYFIGSVNGDLCGSLKEGEVDMLVFNPPYVPTPSVPSIPNPADSAPGSKPKHQAASTAVAPAGEEEPEDLLAFSYAGGVHGMEVTNRLLAQLPLVLRRGKGVAYVVLCRQNRPEEVVERVRGWGGDGDGGWRCEVVGRSGRFGGWEKLVVVRIWRGERF